MSWQDYIDRLMVDPNPVKDAAICGFASAAESVWASTESLKNITADEIRKMAHDRGDLLINGAFLAGIKCRVLNDQMEMASNYSCALKTIPDADGNSYNVCVGKTNKALVIAFGKKDSAAGQLSERVYKMVTYLRASEV